MSDPGRGGLPGFGVARPVLTSMLALMVMVLGVVATLRLPVDLLPEIEMPSLTVSTTWEGASPEVVERMVTQLVEEAVATVTGVEELSSISAEGTSSVTVTFAQGTDLDAAANDVRDRIDQMIDELPEEATRPQLRKFDIASFPVVILGVASDLDPVELTELVELQVQYRFERLPGVASVETFGSYDREIRVELDLDRMRALQLPVDRILQALRDANVEAPAGEIDVGRFEISLQAPGEYSRLDEIEATVVALRNGAPVTLGEIATVRDTHQELTRLVRVNGQRGLRVGIRKQSSANTADVAAAVMAEMERVNRDLPQIRITPVIDQGGFIERSIANVASSVAWGGGLAVLVLVLFLGDLRATAVIAVAIPICVLSTFALLEVGGFSLNLMTLGGLALGVGLMIDNAIVVVENVFRRRAEEGETTRVAAVRGAGEVGAALLASTATTVVIFLPLMFAEGVVGLMFRELALVVAISLSVSLVVALGLVPMLASRWMGEGGLTRGARVRAAIVAVEARYAGVLRTALDWRWLTLASAALFLALGVGFAPRVGTEFQPPSDEGEVRVVGEMEPGTRLGLVDRQIRSIERVIAERVPELTSSVVTVGPSGRRPDAGSEGEIRLNLGPSGQRARSNVEIAADLRAALTGEIPGMAVRVRAPQGQFLLERVLSTDDGITVEIRGHDLDVLGGLTDQVTDALAGVPGVVDVRANRAAGVPQNRLVVDRLKAETLGVSMRRIGEVLQTAVAGAQAGEFRTAGASHRILVRLAEARNLSVEEILDLTATSTAGVPIALRNLVEVEEGRAPAVIDRKDQQRAVTVSANVAGRDLGSVAADVRDRLAQIARPMGYDLSLGGNVEAQQDAFAELGMALGLSLVLVYMVLAGQYESLRDPLLVMVAVPPAGVGAVLTLLLTGSTLNIQSGIGCVLLGGIVVNNAILIVDQASRLVAAGSDPVQAALEAGRRRFRPVLMTTLTTVLGLFPLALGLGEGADAQAPMARVVVGGLMVSTVMVLVVVPTLYAVVTPSPTPPGPVTLRGAGGDA